MSNRQMLEATENFITAYHANAALCADYADWDCVICLQADDADQQVTLTIRGGKIQLLSPLANEPANAPTTALAKEYDLTVNAARQTLIDILELKLNPNQPYLFGELTLQGEESDFMRVDYIVGMLCRR